MDRRKFLVASASAVAVCTLVPSALGQPWIKHAWNLAVRYPDLKRIWPNHMLAEAWAITNGKDEAGMYTALTERFGPFPIWFIDHRAEVVIKGVLDITSKIAAPALAMPYEADEVATEWPRKGYMCCDVRGQLADGRSLLRWAIDDPLPQGMHYYEPVVLGSTH
jgi:hypothetical protein